MSRVQRFNSQPPEGGWPTSCGWRKRYVGFQLTAARRRLDAHPPPHGNPPAFQLTAARRRLGNIIACFHAVVIVSTHSRPKAAGVKHGACCQRRWCFNSQPPEGGWPHAHTCRHPAAGFQLTAARRRLAALCKGWCALHSFNSQPPEGGWELAQKRRFRSIRFNSQPPEGGWTSTTKAAAAAACFNSQPPEGGWRSKPRPAHLSAKFQLTAARRRLV